MNTKIFSVDEKDSIELVLKIMEWKNIHHMPVINSNKELVGLLSWQDVQLHKNDRTQEAVNSIMITNIITISQHETIIVAKDLMAQHDINCLPVIHNNNKLIGIITTKDL